MLESEQNYGEGTTLFKVEHDEHGWKAVVRRGKEIIKERYALSRTEADSIRTGFINEFWGNQLN